MEQKPTLAHRLAQLALMSAGSFLVAAGVYFFKFPNHFSMGGVSGLVILLGKAIPGGVLSTATINTILTVAFLVLGFLALDKSFGFKTVYCSLFYSFSIQALEALVPMHAPLTDQKMLELFFAVILPALGSGILFNISASTGGTDILAMIVKKHTGLDAGKALLASDVLIALGALFLFDVETGLYSLLGLALKSTLVDTVIESLNRRKSFTVVTQEPDGVCRFINQELHRGATVWKGQGAYTHQEQYIILTALSRHQAVLLRNHLAAPTLTRSCSSPTPARSLAKGFCGPNKISPCDGFPLLSRSKNGKIWILQFYRRERRGFYACVQAKGAI